ncbi:MAG: hypothetical protein KY475_22765 [Planctomycetes bacterium]|nr:hypothetical protein [Planctomycetota bacterium]
MNESDSLVREAVAPESSPADAPLAGVAAPQLARAQPTHSQAAGSERAAAEALPAPSVEPQATTPAEDVQVGRTAAQTVMNSAPRSLPVAEAPAELYPSSDAEAITETRTATAPPAATTAPVDAPRRAKLDVAAAEEAPSVRAEQTPAADAVVEADPAEELRADVSLAREMTSAPVAPEHPRREVALAAQLPAPAESGVAAADPADADAAPTSSRPEVALARLSAAASAPAEVIEGAELTGADLAPGIRESAPSAERQEVAIERTAAAAPGIGERSRAGDAPPSEIAAFPGAEELARAETPPPQPQESRAAADLSRRRQSRDADVAEMIDAAPAIELAAGNPDAASTAAAEVALAREKVSLPGAKRLLPVSMKRTSGPSRDFEAGDPSIERVETAPDFNGRSAELARRDSRSPLLMYAEDDIGLQAMLRLRQSEAKEDLLQAFGGSDQTEAAVRRGLAWLARHQHRDGRWSLDRFHELCQEHHPQQQCGGRGRSADTAATGFALLPFLGAGHTHQEGDYADVVGRGLTWLAANQKENGDLFTGGAGNGHMYSHGVAAIALCEAYAMTNDAGLRGPAQKAIDFIVHAQHKNSGGWRYSPGQDGDTSVFGWQIMALKSGEIAELNVPQETLERAKKWLERVGAKGKQLGQFGYTNAHPSPAMTAEALLCLQYLGAERNDPRLLQGGDYLLSHLHPADTSYYWYYATQVMYHLQGEHWRQWNEAQRDALIQSQVKDGAAPGSWNPKDRWERDGGRLYATSLRLLMLEVYYRHLPLYQALDPAG